MTFDRKTRKDAYYYYQSQWSEEPMVYIADRRHTERKQAKIEVKVYSNANQAPVLYQNGKKVGKMQQIQPGLYRHALTLTSGENEVMVKSGKGQKVLSNLVSWQYIYALAAKTKFQQIAL